jgi:hypothetical protein
MGEDKEVQSKGISMEKAIWDKIDVERGDISRSLWIRRLVKEKLGVA